jgi:periplasmic protein CpxP/Spy
MKLTRLIRTTRETRLMLLALLVALAGSFATLAQAQPFAGPGGPGGPAGHGAHVGPLGGHMMERMLDSVNASAEQRGRIRDIMKAATDDLRKQHEAGRGLRDQAMNLFAQPSVDARAAEGLRQQMLQQHDQASRRMMQAMLDASAVLTPEQRAQLGERMTQRRDMRERHHRERQTLEQPKS